MNKQHEFGVFLDELVFVMGRAPDQFPLEDFLPPERQPNFENSYEKLRAAFRKFVEVHGQTTDTERWQAEMERAYTLYKKGDKFGGMCVLNDLYNELEYGKT